MADKLQTPDKPNQTPDKPNHKASHKKRVKLPGWMFPLGVAVAGVGGAAALVLRGCWHAMSWPVRVSGKEIKHHGDEDYSYQVCTKCGIKRLFDERAFRSYGPYGYDLHDLIAQDRARHIRFLKKHADEEAAAGE